MKQLRNNLISLILAVLVVNAAIPSMVAAAEMGSLPAGDQDNLTLVESVDGKLFHYSDVKIKPHRVTSMVLTAYSSTPGQTDDDPFTAASGKRVYDGMVAVNGLPFGTKIKIPALYGEKIFTVDDRMNARYGSTRMDIWMNAPRNEVLKFGVKRAVVEIYFPESPIKVAKNDSI
ncbi:MAG: 3D domain-containing protein [Candidatus Magasanikbacteria bacterium]|nr:3D domain-containing protein [Candidatus Magasanikbacteria bacterium]